MAIRLQVNWHQITTRNAEKPWLTYWRHQSHASVLFNCRELGLRLHLAKKINLKTIFIVVELFHNHQFARTIYLLFENY